MEAESRKKLVDGKPISLTNINEIFSYTQAAREIGVALGWTGSAIGVLTVRMLEAIASQPPALQTRGRHTGLPNNTPSDVVLHLVHPDDVNEWLERQGLDYRWTLQAAELPDPERRLAKLRTLGGIATRRNNDWKFTSITKLVQHEEAEGRDRSSEKTIRADLKQAAQAERDAKSAGYASGLGQR